MAKTPLWLFLAIAMALGAGSDLPLAFGVDLGSQFKFVVGGFFLWTVLLLIASNYVGARALWLLLAVPFFVFPIVLAAIGAAQI